MGGQKVVENQDVARAPLEKNGFINHGPANLRERRFLYWLPSPKNALSREWLVAGA